MNKDITSTLKLYDPIVSAGSSTTTRNHEIGKHMDMMIQHVFDKIRDTNKLTKRNSKNIYNSDTSNPNELLQGLDSQSIKNASSSVSRSDVRERDGITPTLASLIEMLVMMIGSARVEEEDKRKVHGFIGELISMSNSSSDSVLKRNIKSILVQGLNSLKLDSDAEYEDLHALESMISTL